jgi:hypothetical protein
MLEVVRFLQRYAELSLAPIVTGTRVTRVRQEDAVGRFNGERTMCPSS